MEISNQTIAAAIVALVGGGSSGLLAAEIRTQTQLAKQQVQLDNLRQTVVSRIADHKVDLANLEAYIDKRAEELNDRIDRLDERKADR